MSSLAYLFVLVLRVTNAQAVNEELIHGWVPEPHGRGTWSILWSCLATIFICTWSSLHLDVPKRHNGWYLLCRKLGWMFLATLAPEIILLKSANNFFEARDVSNTLATKDKKKEWTLTQTQFAFAGGIRTRSPEGEVSKCSLENLATLIRQGIIDSPALSEEELQSRGKSDLVIKLIALLQIIWFVVQTLFRAIQHYQTTAIEIMTVAFVSCSIFIYGFSMFQPQDVEYPTIYEIQNAALAQDETAAKSSPDPSSHAGEEAEPSPLTNTSKQRTDLPSKYVPGWAAETIPAVLFVLFACGFGAFHCLAWNSSFPTSKEQLAWRICSAATTGLPALAALELFVGLTFGWFQYNFLAIAMGVLLFLMVVLYIMGRITLIVLAFMSLRALPANAFQTVNWNSYIPHFAA